MSSLYIVKYVFKHSTTAMYVFLVFRESGITKSCLSIEDFSNSWSCPTTRHEGAWRTGVIALTYTHCTGGWVGPRAGLDTEATGKILSPLP
jgi:hypothetical protein